MSTDLQQALRYLESGAPEKCVRLCDEILAGTPGLIQALYLRGCAAYQAGDVERSVNDLEIVHGNYPEHLHAAYYLGRSLRAVARFEDALAPLTAAAAAPELEVIARYEHATCLARLRRRAEAIDHYLAIL
jgi:tetratricopeptide (TPR) repeat protein